VTPVQKELMIKEAITMKAEQAWQATLGHLQTEMPKAAFETWVRNTQFLSYEDGSFVIGVSNAYARDWLQSRLSSTVNRLLARFLNRSVEVNFIVWTSGDEDDKLEAGSQDDSAEMQTFVQRRKIQQDELETEWEDVIPIVIPNSSVNNRYTFENFVVGANNRLAHAASLAVAEKPAHAYNPLFLYGGVGLGKTHLLHAIGNSCHQRGLQALYVSSEEFTNDLINAIRSRNTQTFRDKYRQIDVLLIDDIQFIAGKESTQEEFFHTFNTLHGQDKQIIISSDRPPKALVTLEERLRSRFEWGLIVDIQPPDLETRLAILRYKAERLRQPIPNSIMELVARRVQSNIRELEGALTRIAAFAELSGMPFTPQLVETALGDLLPRHNQLQPNDIIKQVAQVFGSTVEEICGRSRTREVALPRQVAMYLLREEAGFSLPQIGEVLGGRDHTTVMYGCEKIIEMLDTDDRLRRQVMQVKEQLYGPARAGAF
jgi:chromosomal replication initiator protein